MNDSTSSEFAKLRGRVVLAIVLMGGMIGACGVWAMQAKISGAVIAPGKVVAQAQIKEVQHPHGGIVGQILVANGDTVMKDDILIVLDKTQVKSELGVLSVQISEFTARAARLRAERDNSPVIDFPDEFLTDSALTEIANGERRLFRENMKTLSVQKEQITNRIKQFQKEIVGLLGQQSSRTVEQEILQNELDRIAPLREKKLVQHSKISSLEREFVQISAQIGEVESSIARIDGQILESKLNILDIENRARMAAQTELRGIEARLAELREREVASRDQLLRTELRAPISGVVNGLNVHTVNGVIAPGETVMGIVPKGNLVVEAQLMTTDVDQISIGQIVNLRFSAFNQRTTPEFKGEVLVVGAATNNDPASGIPYYLSTIKILDAEALVGGRELVPGMPVEVFFETGQRTVMSYLVKPFTDQVERAFREE